MILSMTGFGAAEVENDDYKVHVEIKSVNQRFLETNFFMPRILFAAEDSLRRTVKKYAARGKFDARIALSDKRRRNISVKVNKDLAIAYHNALNEVSDALRLPRVTDVAQIAAYPEVFAAEEEFNLPGAEEVLLPAFARAMENLCAMRRAEGKNIYEDFAARLDTLKKLTEELKGYSPVIVEQYRERLKKILAEFLPQDAAEELKEASQTRIVQEVAIYADKVNFDEEIVRLNSHFDQFSAIMEGSDEPVGRKLEFLLQEMNREVNTVGSKANNFAAATLVAEIKNELEKLREQVQNIE